MFWRMATILCEADPSSGFSDAKIIVFTISKKLDNITVIS